MGEGYRRKSRTDQKGDEIMKLYSNEIVFRGHPDKICDQISGAILDECLKQDKYTRAGIECALKNNRIYIFGEITTNAKTDKAEIARRVLKDIGYKEEFQVVENISEQSRDIAIGVDRLGAGDQGMMFGYACNDTKELLPLAQVILIKFAKEYDKLVHINPDVFYPDGKAQITGYYDQNFKLKDIKDFTISYQNNEKNRFVTDAEIKAIAMTICREYGIHIQSFLINPTGKFLTGGPYADSGLTGRKIVVDAYQSFANVGGGCMNGKDPTKVDISGAHKARELAKRILKEKQLTWCELQLSYAIGLEKPLAIYIDSDKGNLPVSTNMIEECKPARIIRDLHLLEPRYEEWAKFGHFANEE